MTTTMLNIKASQPQHTPAGRLLGKMYYGGFLEKALARDEYAGYPHNGGEHTLHLRLKPADLPAFLELVRESFPRDLDGVNEFVSAVSAKAGLVPAASQLQ